MKKRYFEKIEGEKVWKRVNKENNYTEEIDLDEIIPR